MRLFVSVVPDQGAVSHLVDALAALRADAGPVRWTDPARWHVTLDFLGEVTDEDLATAEQRLAQVARRYAPIGPLRLAGGGHFGRRALWVGVAEADPPPGGDDPGARAGSADPAGPQAPTAALRRLARDVQHRLARVAGEPPPRHWRAHLTVGRLRPPDDDPAAAVAALAGYRGPAWTVGEISLVRSHLGPHPRHVPILTLPLSAPGPGPSGA